MAQPEKRENSVLFSLRELRQIEENRVQEEEEATRAAEQQRVQAREAAERAVRDAAEAKARAERDELLAIEHARENAEREARMRVESAEATERQRAQAALEQQRLQQEMELRRAEVAKKRPTWMLAVTAIAVLATIGGVFFAVQRMRESEADKAAKQAAEKVRDEAVKDAQAAQEQVERLAADLDDLDKKVASAVDNVIAAQSDADRANAKSRLAALQKEQREMKDRIAQAKARAARAERLKGAKISKECQENPLAKGCM